MKNKNNRNSKLSKFRVMTIVGQSIITLMVIAINIYCNVNNITTGILTRITDYGLLAVIILMLLADFFDRK